MLRGLAGLALLDTYEAERRPHVTKVVRTAVAIGWAMTKGRERAAHVRRFILALLTRLPARVSPVAAPLPFLRRGALVLRPAMRGRHLAGRPIPQPWVTVEGARVRLDAVLGTGFVVLAGAEPSGDIERLARSIGAPVLRLRRPGDAAPPGSIVDDSGDLFGWLRRARQDTVMLRPDHAVLDSDRVGGSAIAERAASWLPLVHAA